eukprot:1063871-Pleurochrysis_carterae.AAC.1
MKGKRGRREREGTAKKGRKRRKRTKERGWIGKSLRAHARAACMRACCMMMQNITRFAGLGVRFARARANFVGACALCKGGMRA